MTHCGHHPQQITHMHIFGWDEDQLVVLDDGEEMQRGETEAVARLSDECVKERCEKERSEGRD